MRESGSGCPAIVYLWAYFFHSGLVINYHCVTWQMCCIYVFICEGMSQGVNVLKLRYMDLLCGCGGNIVAGCGATVLLTSLHTAIVAVNQLLPRRKVVLLIA